MELSSIWIPILLIAVIGLGVVASYYLFRSLRGRTALTPEERRELAGGPMPALQKRALGSLVWGLLVFTVIAAILTVRGAAEYWENDDLRLLVMGIFLGGLLGQVVILPGFLLRERMRGELDERDQQILGNAPAVQSGLVLVALGAWLLSLSQMYHDQGAVPMVYLYLIFGSIIIVNMIGHSLGILFGYWMRASHGQG